MDLNDDFILHFIFDSNVNFYLFLTLVCCAGCWLDMKCTEYLKSKEEANDN